MDEEKKKPGTRQIPLLNDIVFDSSLPLKAPSRPRAPSTKQGRSSYSPDYDPDTRDLFGDTHLLANLPEDEVAGELRESVDQVIENLVDEFSDEIGRRLREELTEQLSSILEDLNPRRKQEKDVD